MTLHPRVTKPPELAVLTVQSGTLRARLLAARPCEEAIKWMGDRDVEVAWKECEDITWLLWVAGRFAGPVGDPRRKTLVLVACACARLALPFVPSGEDRPRIAIETAEAWTRGEATIDNVQKARDAAHAAVYATYAAAATAAYAAAAAATAAYATYAADAATYAADAAAYAAAAADADAAADAADAAHAADAAYAAYAANAAAGKKITAQCLAIVRAHYPTLASAIG